MALNHDNTNNVEEEEISHIWDFIINKKIATLEELRLIVGILGYNELALNDVIAVRSGYADMDHYLENEPN